PVSCLPNAGLPLNVDGEAVYPLEPEPFAKEMLGFVERYGIRVVGGCCGTTPAHIAAIAKAVEDRAPRSIPQPPVVTRLAGLEQFIMAA
ncbi:MAG: homocysteine S-methyltransferase family protein, partial [Sphingorhabdus sp.]